MSNKSVQLIFVTSNKDKLREVKQILEDNVPIQVTQYDVDLLEFQSSDPDDITRAKCMEAARILGPSDRPIIIEDTALNFNAFGGGLPGPYVKWFLDKVGPEGLYKLLAAYPDKTGSAVCTFAFCPPQGSAGASDDMSTSNNNPTCPDQNGNKDSLRPFKLSNPGPSSTSGDGPNNPKKPQVSFSPQHSTSLHGSAADLALPLTAGPPFGPDSIPNPKDITLCKGVTTGRIVEPRQGVGKDGAPLGFGWDPCFEPDGGPNANLAPGDGRRLTYAQMTAAQKNSISHRCKALINLRNFLIKKYLK